MALERGFRRRRCLQPEVIRSSAGSPSQPAIPKHQTPAPLFAAWRYVLSRRTDEEWRSGMNDSPMFVVATPQAFYELTLTQDVDPATGKPNPAATERFFSTHPEARHLPNGQRPPPGRQLGRPDIQQSERVPLCQCAMDRVILCAGPCEHTAPDHLVDHATLAKLGPDFSRKISSNARSGAALLAACRRLWPSRATRRTTRPKCGPPTENMSKSGRLSFDKRKTR